MAVEALGVRALAAKARVSLNDEAKAKVKRKTKVEDAEALTGRTTTRTRTRTRAGRWETSLPPWVLSAHISQNPFSTPTKDYLKHQTAMNNLKKHIEHPIFAINHPATHGVPYNIATTPPHTPLTYKAKTCPQSSPHLQCTSVCSFQNYEKPAKPSVTNTGPSISAYTHCTDLRNSGTEGKNPCFQTLLGLHGILVISICLPHHLLLISKMRRDVQHSWKANCLVMISRSQRADCPNTGTQNRQLQRAILAEN